MPAIRAAQITILFIVVVVAVLPAGAEFAVKDGNDLVKAMREYEKDQRDQEHSTFGGGFLHGLRDGCFRLAPIRVLRHDDYG